jgi:hypothetical protein
MMRRVCLHFVLATALTVALPVTTDLHGGLTWSRAFSQPLCQPYLVKAYWLDSATKQVQLHTSYLEFKGEPKCRDYACVARGWCYSELIVGMLGAPQNLIWGCLETRCVGRVKLPTWHRDWSAPVSGR